MTPEQHSLDWTPQRRAQLDAHIARLLGWKDIIILHTNVVFGEPPDAVMIGKHRIPNKAPQWSLGVMATWDLARDLCRPGGFGVILSAGEDPAITICKQWCAWKGEPYVEAD